MPRIPILVGKIFGDWMVLGPGSRSTHWRCKCACEVIQDVNYANLRRGLTLGCRACVGSKISKAKVQHGHSPHSGKFSQAYNSWRGIIQRCLNPNCHAFPVYGGAGIGICDKWKTFSGFLEDMGNPPGPGYTVDRKDGTLGYFKGNCQWATKAEQSNNRKNNIKITIEGATHNLSEWARISGRDRHVIKKRLKRGVLPKDAVYSSKVKYPT